MEAVSLNLRMYNLFRKNLNLSETHAQEFVQVIDEAIKEQNLGKHENTLERVYRDLQSLKDYFEVRFTEIDKTFAKKEDIAQVRKEAAEIKADLIKWMFIFWIGQVAATFGFISLFLRK